MRSHRMKRGARPTASKARAKEAKRGSNGASESTKNADVHTDWSADAVWEALARPLTTFKSYAIVSDGIARPYDICELKVHRIVSRRRHHHELLGRITASPCAHGTSVPRFAAGDFCLARSDDADILDGEHCVISLQDGVEGDAMILDEYEGTLEEDELRLLAKRVEEDQRLALADDSVGDDRGEMHVMTREGDVVLSNAFRPPGTKEVACFFRRAPPED